MQCKDIPDRPILEFLDRLKNTPVTHWHYQGPHLRSVRVAMPEDVNDKLALAKMRQLNKRKLIDGCSCGCRGDWFITQKGRDWIRGIAT